MMTKFWEIAVDEWEEPLAEEQPADLQTFHDTQVL
jgi:hypothetical protein